MFVLQRKSGAVLKTNVADWMADQEYTEVFDFSSAPVSQEEMEITRVLDSLLGEVLNHVANIDQTVAMLRPKKLIQGRVAQPGEQSLGSALGSAYDQQFKALLLAELASGRLKPFAGRLVVVPAGKEGPDVYMQGSCMIAWDVTSRGDIDLHIQRDVYGRAFNRYYLLVWDSPRTESTTLIREIARSAGTQS